jgi:2-polyprenyl-3-methyl-5-hydroxy-6-metoxy-1,4-benzoquinol methylase
MTSWGINSEKQKIRNFKNRFNRKLNILEIGPGKGLLIDKIKNVYGSDNYFAMQPKDNEYSENNDKLKEKLQDNFLEYTLEDYVKLKDSMKFDIIFIFKWNIGCPNHEKFIDALSKILNHDGIIYISTVETYRFHKYEKKNECFWIRNLINSYFDTYIGVTGVGNERYGEIEAKHK